MKNHRITSQQKVRADWPQTRNPYCLPGARLTAAQRGMCCELFNGGESVERIAFYYRKAASTIRRHIKLGVAQAKAEGYKGREDGLCVRLSPRGPHLTPRHVYTDGVPPQPAA